MKAGISSEDIDAIAMEVRKVGKTRWIQHTHLFKNDEYECSDCGAIYNKPYATCPNCNSKMGKTKYEASWVDEMEVYDDLFGD